jgi:hypothetical protein
MLARGKGLENIACQHSLVELKRGGVELVGRFEVEGGRSGVSVRAITLAETRLVACFEVLFLHAHYGKMYQLLYVSGRVHFEDPSIQSTMDSLLTGRRDQSEKGA